MSRWARLTWQAGDPSALSADVAWRLGVEPRPDARNPGAFLVPLGGAELELVPWRSEGAVNAPQAAGRLVLEPLEGDERESAPAEASPLLLVGVGWATVELDRAEAELEAWLEPAAPTAGVEGDEPHLGARVRVRGSAGLPGQHLVLLEPATEGRLAASMARDGEGPCTLYLLPEVGLDAWVADGRRRGLAIGAFGGGPFGRSVLLPGAAPAGPFVIVVAHPRPSSRRAPPGTIRA